MYSATDWCSALFCATTQMGTSSVNIIVVSDYYSLDAPEGSIAAGDDIGTLESLEEFGVATDVSQLEVLVLARARAYAIINKVTA